MSTHPRDSEFPSEKLVTVVLLRLLCVLTFQTIADKLHLRNRAVQDISGRALMRTESGLRESFIDVLRNVKDAPRSGRPAGKDSIGIRGISTARTAIP